MMTRNKNFDLAMDIDKSYLFYPQWVEMSFSRLISESHLSKQGLTDGLKIASQPVYHTPGTPRMVW